MTRPSRPVQREDQALGPTGLQRLVLAAVDPYVDRDDCVREYGLGHDVVLLWATHAAYALHSLAVWEVRDR
ncbi:hypothetical protein ABT112_06810 [Streptomyces sp. NPDC002055]|uniref:hypothetical protein n=1 Tax=Streptomyces sp. NPDC002055 TaxID=3154534 RepID=UPI0033189ECE